MSHTGSVAGSQAAYRAAFERAGVIIVDEVEALLDTCSFFAKAPPPQGARRGGGRRVRRRLHHAGRQGRGAAASRCRTRAPETMAVLERLIPEYGAPGNPCDMTAQVLSTPAEPERVLRGADGRRAVRRARRAAHLRVCARHGAHRDHGPGGGAARQDRLRGLADAAPRRTGRDRGRAEPARRAVPLDAPLHGRAGAVAPPRRAGCATARPVAAPRRAAGPRTRPPRCSTARRTPR